MGPLHQLKKKKTRVKIQKVSLRQFSKATEWKK